MPITQEEAAKAIREVLKETLDKQKTMELGTLQSFLRRHPETLTHVPEGNTSHAIVGFLLAEMAAAAAAQPIAAPRDSYVVRLNKVPAPSQFTAIWPDFQDVGEALEDPLFHCLRPSSAKGTSPALMHPAFGKFLDRVASASVDKATAQTLVRLIRDMSASYMDTSGKQALSISRPIFGERHTGVQRGREVTRAQKFREAFLELMQAIMRNKPTTLEPAAVSLLGCAHMETSQSQTDGSLRVIDMIGTQIGQVIIIEVKEEEGAAGMQLLAYYACLVRSEVARQAPAALQTCLPTLGIEIIGNMFRVHALYYAEKVSSQPLTPMLHLSDMGMSVPGYNEVVARVLVALVQTADDLIDEYAKFKGPQPRPVPGATRDTELAAGIPYMLRSRFAYVQRLSGSGQVYLCEDAEGGKRVAKVLPMQPEQYPFGLHEELWQKGLAPRLLALQGYEGGFSLVEMEYLDPGEGWVVLDRFTGSTQALREACEVALEGLHSCLGGNAVHGDVRIPNIFLREVAVPGSSTPKVQVRFIDLDWSGQSGEVQYPIFISSKEFPWSLGPILQEHDVAMLETALRKAEERRPQQWDGGMGLQAGGRQAPQPRPGPGPPCALGQAPAAVLQRAHHMRPLLAAPCLTRATHVVAVRPHLPGTRAPGSHSCSVARVGMFGGAP